MNNETINNVTINKETLSGSWIELKGKLQKAWARLTDDDLLRIEGNWNELSGRLQKTYGYSKQEALDEIENFKQEYLSSPEFKNGDKSTASEQ